MAVQIKHMAEQIRYEDLSIPQCHTQSTDQLLPCLQNHGAYIFSVVVQEQWHHNPSKWNSILVNMT